MAKAALSKMAQLQALREANYARAMVRQPAARPPVTAKLRMVVTAEPNVTNAAPPSNVTKRTKPAGSGRRKVYASGAEKQKAYRERRKMPK